MVPNVLSHPSLSIYLRKKIREKDVTAYMVEAANPPSSRSLALWPSKRLRWRPVAVVQRWSFKLELVAVTKTLKLGGLATMMGIVKLEDCGAGEEYAHLPPLWPDPPLPATSSTWPLVAPSRSSSGSIGHMSRVFTACPKRARDLPLLPFMSELELSHWPQPPPASMRGARARLLPPPPTATFMDEWAGHHAAPHLSHHHFLRESPCHRPLLLSCLPCHSITSDQCHRCHLLRFGHWHHRYLGPFPIISLAIGGTMGSSIATICSTGRRLPRSSLGRGVAVAKATPHQSPCPCHLAVVAYWGQVGEERNMEDALTCGAYRIF